MKLIKDPGPQAAEVPQAASNGHGGKPGPLTPAGNPEALRVALDAVKAAREADGADRADRADRITGIIETAATAKPGLSEIQIAALRGAITTDRPAFMRSAEFDAAFTRAQPESHNRGHAVNVTDEGFTYSCGIPECGQCGGKPPALYLDGREMGRLPYVIARAITGPKHGTETQYILSRSRDSRPRLITWQQTDSGEWADLLGITRSAQATVIKALGTAIRQAAGSAPEETATVNPRDRIKDGPLKGHLPQPGRDTSSLGYMETPDDIDESDQAGWRTVLISLAAKCPKVALFMGASAGAPFTAAGLRTQRHIWDAYGEPRNGKTTALTAAGSIWGDPRLQAESGLIMPANATSLGVLRHAGMLGILPTFMDEIAAGDWTPADRVKFAMAAAQGGTRTRAPRQGHGEDVTPPTNSIIFVTGNEKFTSGLGAGNTAGTIPRVVEIPAPFTTDAETADQIEEAAKSSFGYFGPRILDAVTPDDFRDGALDIEGGLPGSGGGERGTLVRHVAQAIMGARVLDWIAEAGSPAPGTMETAAREAALEYLGEQSERAPDGQTALERIHEMYVTEPSRWPNEGTYTGSGGTPPPGGHSRNFAGFRDDDYFYVLPATWEQVIKDTGISGVIALRELYASGALEIPPSLQSGNNKRWKVPGPRWAKRPQCFRINRSHMPGNDDGEGEGPAPDSGPESSPPGPAIQPELADPAGPAEPSNSPGEPQAARVDNLAARRADWVAQARERRRVRTTAQESKLAEALAVIDHGGEPRILDALEGRHRDSGQDETGAFAPLAKKFPREPYWRPDQPWHIIQASMSCRNYGGWRRKGARGPYVTLDRVASWPTGASAATIPHDALTNSGEADLDISRINPGYYLMECYRWTETGMPSPFPADAKPGQSYWLPSPVAELLAKLTKDGRWPDSVALDSWTSERGSRLSEWSHFIGELRKYVITYYGYDSEHYKAVKRAYGQNGYSLMAGETKDLGHPVHKCRMNRTDWYHIIVAQAACNFWRAADKTGCAAELKDVDTLIIPARKLDGLISAGTIKVDETNTEFGTWHIKEGETR